MLNLKKMAQSAIAKLNFKVIRTKATAGWSSEASPLDTETLAEGIANNTK